MNFYEVIFIVKAELEDALKEELTNLVKEIISKEGEVLVTDVWGNKKLAYPIQKKDTGYYVLITFKSSPDLPKELDRRLKILDNVIRHIIVGISEEEAEKAGKKIDISEPEEIEFVKDYEIDKSKSKITEEPETVVGIEATKELIENTKEISADEVDVKLHEDVAVDAEENSGEVLDEVAIADEKETEV